MVLDSLLAVIFYEKSGTHLRSVITGHWFTAMFLQMQWSLVHGRFLVSPSVLHMMISRHTLYSLLPYSVGREKGTKVNIHICPLNLLVLLLKLKINILLGQFLWTGGTTFSFLMEL